MPVTRVYFAYFRNLAAFEAEFSPQCSNCW